MKIGENKMSIDTKLVRKAIRRCDTGHITKSDINEFEARYMSHASTTEEAAGLAILLGKMQEWREKAILFGGSAIGFLDREAYAVSRGVSEYLIRPQYEDRGFRGILSFIFSPWHEFPLTNDTERLNDYNKKEWEFSKRLKELYQGVIA